MNWQQFFQDTRGNYSSARLINIVVCVGALVICGMLAWNDKMTEGYFVALLAYGAGVQSYSKFAETRRKEDPQ